MTDVIIARNVLSRLAVRIVAYGLGFTSSILLVRYLGVDRLGQFNYASTFASLVGLVANVGLPILLTRDAARDRSAAGKHLGAVLTLHYVLAAVAAVVIAASGALMNPREYALPIAIFGLGIAVNALGAPYLAMLNAFEAIHVSSAIELVNTVLRVVLILAAIQLRLDVASLVALLLASPLVNFVLTRAVSNRYCARPSYAYNRALLPGLLAATIPFGLMVIFNNVYYRIDVIMLEKMKGDAAVGIYTAAYKIIDVLMILGAGAVGVLYPRMAAQAHGAPEALKRMIAASCRYLAALGIPAAVAITILAPWIIRVLFGEAFSAAVAPLAILVWAVAIMLVYMPMAHALNATGREWSWILVLSVNTVVNVGLNLVLIPAHGVIGAAIATVACEIVGFGLVTLFARDIAAIRLVPVMGPVALAALLMAVPLWYTRDDHVLAGVAVAVPVYGAALYVLGFFTADQKTMLRRLLVARWGR